MRKSDLQFINDTIFMREVLYEPSMNKTANDFLSGVMSDIAGKVTGLKSAEDVLAFLVPGVFWTLGFKKLTLIYTVAEGFGFNFSSFFASLREGLRPIIEGLFNGKSEGTSTSEIGKVVENSAQMAATDSVEPEKLQDAIEKTNSHKYTLDTAKIVLAFGKKYNEDPLFYAKIKEFADSTLGRKARSGITGTLVKVFTWLLSTVFYSLGFAVIGIGARRALGLGGNKEDEGKPSAEHGGVQTVSDKTVSGKDVVLHLNPNADSNMYTTTYNDNNHVWLLHININTIKDQLMDWTKELYPQLTDPAAFSASSSFNRTVKMFQDRNKDTDKFGILAVPTPYTSIKQIVDSFAADVASKMP